MWRVALQRTASRGHHLASGQGHQTVIGQSAGLPRCEGRCLHVVSRTSITKRFLLVAGNPDAVLGVQGE